MRFGGRPLPRAAERDASDGRSALFLALYGLAWAGGVTGYTPFLTIILPARVAALAPGAVVEWLGTLALAGAVAASLANIAAGWISDRAGTRVLPAALGLAAFAVLLPMFAFATTLPRLVALLVLWQTALNFILAPLAALAADRIPDRQRGRLGGLLALAPATGALAGVIVTIRGLADFTERLLIIDAVVVAMVAPLLVALSRSNGLGSERLSQPAEKAATDGPLPRALQRRFARMWVARLLVQIGEATMFAFLYLWLRTLDPSFDDATAARIFMAMLAAGIPVSMAAGAWSDRRGEPFLPLRVFAGLGAVGLVVMALGGTIAVVLAGYALFSLVTLAFLSLHSAQAMRVLPRASSRGRDLGIFNLTNTFPSLVMPWLALSLLPGLGFEWLFTLLAVLVALAMLVLPRQRACDDENNVADPL